ncbi:MAG: DUF4145 domain-containing protein [Shewanella sp.]|nr:DUF4145 domain-containing protein [Shewanella sp.]MCF1430249.1 DUF4145 domain-containing protein [Shewanella sp.]MCF1437955.1 DUF4145 domain-containing protein [Shewanella sp.]MCF1459589.1 DUF4145 domain-containing protein [Shewanella sp.]
MKDAEFVRQLVPELAQDYEQAKGYVGDVPTQALLHIRALAHKLTGRLAGNKLSFDSPNLYDRIEQLNQARLIDVPTARALHKLRGHGNRGAHPEKYHLTREQLQTLAARAVRDCLSLFEHLNYKWHRKPAPEYQFDATATLSAKELCYRAVMEDDADAQYLLAMSLKSNALIEQEQEQALADSADVVPLPRSDKSFAKAAYWFSLCASQIPEALFESGVALLHGYSATPDPCAGEQAIADAAAKGVKDAQALLGYFYLVGSECHGKDESKAQTLLQQAADAGNIEAMSNLGVLWYQRGELPKAHYWICRAAREGFANAQYHLALMLARGEGCQQDLESSEYWLAEAAEHGNLDAMVERARHMLNDDSAFGSDLSKAEAYLRQAIRYGHSVPAMLELSTALADGVLGRIDVVGAAALLSLARSRADPQEAAIVHALADSLRAQVDTVLPLTVDKEQTKALKRARELLA